MGKLSSLLSFLNSIMPKKKRILFNSFSDVSGNSLALYDYIVNEREDLSSEYDLVWTVSDISVEQAKEILRNRTGVDSHKCYTKKSVGGIFRFLTSKYIVSTHGYFSQVKTPAKQTHINLWHGMPFKRIGRLIDEEVHSNGKSDEADKTIATSPVFKEIMAKAFGIDEESVAMTGQPCNDDLLKSTDALMKLGVVPNLYNKVIAWLPTYRKSVVGDIRLDGNENSFGVVDVLQNNFDELDAFLKEKELLLVIKPHPMDAVCNMSLPQSDNIKVVLNNELSEKYIQLYELLHDCDVLLTDYSSVFIDFLVTNKPMAFVCDDIDEYGGSRGFSFDNPRDLMPGEVISSFDELKNYLNNIDSFEEKWRDRYQTVKNKLNPYDTICGCKNVCDAFFEPQNSI